MNNRSALVPLVDLTDSILVAIVVPTVVDTTKIATRIRTRMNIDEDRDKAPAKGG